MEVNRDWLEILQERGGEGVGCVDKNNAKILGTYRERLILSRNLDGWTGPCDCPLADQEFLMEEYVLRVSDRNMKKNTERG